MKRFLILLSAALLCSCTGHDAVDIRAYYPFGSVSADPLAFIHPYCPGMDELSAESCDIEAGPGFCSLFDKKAGVKIECTAGKRTSWYRLFWKSGQEHRVRITADELNCGKCVMWKKGPVEIAGKGDRDFIIRFSREFRNLEFDNDSTSAILSFGQEGGPVTLEIGYSFISQDKAAANIILDGGPDCLDFDKVAKSAADAWKRNTWITVGGGSSADVTSFHQALAKTASCITLYSDPAGWFRNPDGEAERETFGEMYSIPGNEDDIFDWIPLAALIYPEQLKDLALSSFYTKADSASILRKEALPLVAAVRNRGMLGGMDSSFAEKLLGEKGLDLEFPKAEKGPSSYVLSCIGLVPDTDPSTGYSLVTPKFEKAVITLSSGNILTISRDRRLRTNAPKIQFNGAELTESHLSLEAIQNGGLLEFNN